MKLINTLKHFIVFCFFSCSCFGLELNPLFTDHMVLQRDHKIRIFGNGTPGETVSVIFSDKKENCIVKQDGTWEVKFPEFKASASPKELKVLGNEVQIKLKDILIGDVWVCAGQSNMGWALHQTLPKPKTFQNSNMLRLLQGDKRAAADSPQQKFPIDKNFKKSWQHATEEFALKFSAVGYYFGLNVSQETDVPIGLIQSSLGGTSIDCWIPKQTLESHTEYEAIMAEYNRHLNWAKENNKSLKVIHEYNFIKSPAYLYNGLIHPLTHFPIKGMIWYQGESNASTYTVYQTLFPHAIKAWRDVWGIGDFHFFFVQLPGFKGKNEWQKGKTKFWPYQREAQTHALKLPNTAMAVTLDCGHYSNVHPKAKHKIGKRLALHAIKLDKKETIANGPLIDAIEIKGSTAFLKFKSVSEGLETRKVILSRTADTAEDDPDPFIITKEKLSGFEVSGSDGKFYTAEASFIGKNGVRVSSDQVGEIKYIRYGFKDFPLCNLYNSTGLMAAPFRTDDF